MHCLAEPLTHPLISSSSSLSHYLSAQILTAQFRQMEQELAEAVKQRQQWAEQTSRADAELAALRTNLEVLEKQSTELARQESELASLRELEHVSQEALERERTEVARLEREVVLMKEAEQASHDASERDRAEIVRLESELATMREAADHASQDASEREKSAVDKLERELASLKEEHEDAQRKGEVLAEIWRHLCSLALEDVQAADETPVPADLSMFMNTVQSIETQLRRLKDEHRESEEHCVELTHTMETLQGKKMTQVVFVYGFQCVNLNPSVFSANVLI